MARPKNGLRFALDRAGKGKPVADSLTFVAPRGGYSFREPFDLLLEDGCARVTHSVDPMPHSHDASPGVELAFDPRARPLGRADRIEHVEHGARGTAMD